MSHESTYFVANNPQAVLKTPVEVWQEIIDHVLYDPIAFLTDPYYPGCNFHTAFNEWTDRRRLRELEVQRGTLRLVSQSWKFLIDSRSCKYFEPYFCSNPIQQSAWAQSARRLNFDQFCIAGEHDAGSNASQCNKCQRYRTYMPVNNENPHFGDHPFGATVVRLPTQKDSKLYLEVQNRSLDSVFPKARALFVWYRDAPTMQLLSWFTGLTFLSICLERTDFLQINDAAPQFPSLKTFHLELIDDERIDFLEQWDMPLLAHFQLCLPALEPGLTPLATHIGKGLVRFCLRIHEEYVFLPDNFWQALPVLQYFSTTIIKPNSNFPVPPFGHSLRTLGLLEETNHMDDARDIAGHLIELWEEIDTISDCHSWDDAPECFGNLIDSPDGSLDFQHHHMDTNCWQCIKNLYLTCRKHGLRYEDREGRTLSGL